MGKPSFLGKASSGPLELNLLSNLLFHFKRRLKLHNSLFSTYLKPNFFRSRLWTKVSMALTLFSDVLTLFNLQFNKNKTLSIHIP